MPSITFFNNGNVTVKQDYGSSASGAYVIDEPTNMITFSSVTPNIVIADWIGTSTTADNKWKIVKIERATPTSPVTGIWFGKRDPNKAEYMVFHFLLR